jgi:hypothetical protein
MPIDLNLQDIETLLESLDQSKLHVSETTDEGRQARLARIEAVTDKIREARRVIRQRD